MRARLFVTVSALVLVGGLLAGCTADAQADAPQIPEAVDLCTVAAPAGPVSDAVTVDGAVGSPAALTTVTPLAIQSTERTVLVEGDGEKIEATDLVAYGMTSFDAATGAVLHTQGYEGVQALPVPAASVGQFLGCTTVGSRVVVTVPATDLDPATVQVFDVLGRYPGHATGEAQKAAEGMPTVEVAEGGAPTLTLPGGEPPADTEVAVLKKGDGAVVQPGDGVMLHYSGVRWSDGTVFDSSWAQGAPTVLVTTSVIDGYREALEGQTVGSQILAVVPPAAGYGDGTINEDDLTGETLVFVIDILATAPAA